MTFDFGFNEVAHKSTPMKENPAHQAIDDAVVSQVNKRQVLGDDGKEWNLK